MKHFLIVVINLLNSYAVLKIIFVLYYFLNFSYISCFPRFRLIPFTFLHSVSLFFCLFLSAVVYSKHRAYIHNTYTYRLRTHQLTIAANET